MWMVMSHEVTNDFTFTWLIAALQSLACHFNGTTLSHLLLVQECRSDYCHTFIISQSLLKEKVKGRREYGGEGEREMLKPADWPCDYYLWGKCYINLPS